MLFAGPENAPSNSDASHQVKRPLKSKAILIGRAPFVSGPLDEGARVDVTAAVQRSELGVQGLQQGSAVEANDCVDIRAERVCQSCLLSSAADVLCVSDI